MISVTGIAVKTDALQSLKPNAQWVLRGDELEWLDAVQTEPTQEEIDAEVIRLQAVYDAQEYARDRATEYPTIGDQLDMLWHAIDTGDWTAAKVKLTSFYTELKAVKDKYPKE
jgi:hypothetical protein